MSINNPLSAPISRNMNYFSRTDEESSEKSDCGDCFDLLIFINKFVNKTIIGSDEFFSKALTIGSPQTLFKAVQEQLLEGMDCIYESHPNFMLSCILEKVILRV